MNDKVMYAIVQCKELALDQTSKCFENTNIDLKDVKCYLKIDKNNAQLKNQVIKDANDNGYRYVFIIENDVLIKDVSIFEKYIQLMKKYNLGLVFYGYHGGMNCVLDGTPNPGVRVKIGTETQIFTRIPCDAVIGINLFINQQKFDENFNYIEFNEYIKRCKDFKVIPFNGFYFDIENCWDYFAIVDDKPIPKIIDKEKIQADKKYVATDPKKFTLQMDSDVNILLDYLANMETTNGKK